MKIYFVILEDGHIDTEVEAFVDKEKAIERARFLAHNLGRTHPESFQEEDIEGWLYCARYSSENDRVRVVEGELIE